LVTPRITNKLRGSLGEIYYKEYCDQKGWAYTSLENIYESKNPKWTFIFKKGFKRIKITLPKEIRNEVNLLANPTNNNFASPSFVFDFLACKVGTHKTYSQIQPLDNFAWVECKTGSAVFTSNQVNTMSRISLPLAIFHTSDVLEKPELINMDCDIKPGKEWIDEFDPIDNEIYEFVNRKMKSKISSKISNKGIEKSTKQKENHVIKEIQKNHPKAYESWTESDDKFLKKYWNEKSNHQNSSEKVLQLSKRLGRQSGGILSRLKKLKLES
jgi:hypothetical protein